MLFFDMVKNGIEYPLRHSQFARRHSAIGNGAGKDATTSADEDDQFNQCDTFRDYFPLHFSFGPNVRGRLVG